MTREQDNKEAPHGIVVRLLTKLRNKIFDPQTGVFRHDSRLARLVRPFFTTLKVFAATTRQFLKDDCVSKAASIAYTTLISMIPALTVFLTFYSIFSGVGDKKEELFREITLFLTEHNIRINIDPILDAISGLIENAGSIGGIGIVVLVFSATGVLRTLERSLNSIWRVNRQRALLIRFTYYWAILTLGPLLFITGTTVAARISEAVSAPAFFSAELNAEGQLWLTGSKGTIQVLSNKNLDNLHFRSWPEESINFDKMTVHKYLPEEGRFEPVETPVRSEVWSTDSFRDSMFIGSEGFIVGENGAFLHSRNGGKRWEPRKLGNMNLVRIIMTSRQDGYLLAADGKLLRTRDGGESWTVQDWKDEHFRFRDVAVFGQTIAIAGDRGHFLISRDGGKSWDVQQLDGARQKNRYRNLNSVLFQRNGRIWLAGNAGVLLESRDLGRQWVSHRVFEYSLFSLLAADRQTLFAAGERGQMLITRNGGRKWQERQVRDIDINRLFQSNGQIWAVGKQGLIVRSQDGGKNWSGRDGRSFILWVINFIAPFFIIWILFLTAYMVIPNRHIPLKAAAVGASFTSAVWVIFILLFIFYVQGFARGTFAIYGALVALPLFLILVYASAQIALYGAELAFVLAHPQTHQKFLPVEESNNEALFFTGLYLLYYVYRKFESGRGSSRRSELSRKVCSNPEELEYYLKIFSGGGYLKSEDEDIFPGRASRNVVLKEVFQRLGGAVFSVRRGCKAPGILKSYFKNVAGQVQASGAEALGEDTLQDLLEKQNEQQ